MRAEQDQVDQVDQVVTVSGGAWRALWWLCLGVAPAVLVAIELFHPAAFTREPGMWRYLSEPQGHAAAHMALAYAGPQWWFTLHMIQTPMVGLVCLGLWLMTAGIGPGAGAWAHAVAWLSRIAVFVTLIYFTVLDAIGGIGLGRQILRALELEAAGELSAEQMAGLTAFLNAMWVDPLVGGVGSTVSLTASWGAFASAALVALALFLARRAPLLPLLVLAFGFGWQLQESHAAMHGPLAFSLLAVAAAWIWFRGAVRPGSVPPERWTWV
jgi:hypothetical protein